MTNQFFDQGEQINGTNYYYTCDHLGSVREMTDSSGTIHASYDYDSWGRQTKLAGDLDADFGYTDFYVERTVNLDLTLFRVYDSNKGRWLSRDPLGEGIGPNLYAYATNNPLKFIDPLGLAGIQISLDITSFGINENFPLFDYNNGSLSLDPNFGSYHLSAVDALVGGDLQFHYDTDTQLCKPGWSVAYGVNKFLSIGADSTGGIVNVGLGVGLPVAVSVDF